MQYKVAVYTDDYLMLLELATKLDKEYPLLELMVFGPKKLEEAFLGNSSDYVIENIDRIGEADILILLSEPQNDTGSVANFDGSIVDLVGYKFAEGAEVYNADEPIMSILKNIDISSDSLSAVVQLPACIFGQDGVEDLMEETKSIFTFASHDNIVFHNRLAFNIHFEPNGLNRLPIGRTIEQFKGEGGDISARLVPLSTVFTLDVFSDTDFILNDNDGYVENDGEFTAEELPENDVMTIKRRNGYSFSGDYIRLYIKTIVDRLKEVIN